MTYSASRLVLVTAFLAIVPVLLGAQSATSDPLPSPLWAAPTPFTAGQTAQHLEAATQYDAAPDRAKAKMVSLAQTSHGQHSLSAFARTQSVYGDLVGAGKTAAMAPLMEYADDGQASLSIAVKAASVGVEAALAHAWNTGQSPDAIRYIGKAEMDGYLTGQYAGKVLAATAEAYGTGHRVEILSVAFGDQPMLSIYPADPYLGPANVLVATASGDYMPYETYARFPEIGPIEEQIVGSRAGFAGALDDGTIQSVGPGVTFVGKPFVQPVPGVTVAALDPLIGDRSPVNRSTVLDNIGPNMARTGCGPKGELPCFMSAVSLHNEGRVQCSGVLVAPEWVLTAAHCTCDSAPQTASIGNVTPNRFGIAMLEARIVGAAQAGSTPTASVPVSSERYYYGDLPGQPAAKAFCAARTAWKAMPRPFAQDVDDARTATVDSPPIVLDWIDARQNTYAQRDLVLIRLRRPLALSGFETTATLADPKILDGNPRLWIAGFGRNDYERAGGHKTVLFGEMTASLCSTTAHRTVFGCVPDFEMIFEDPRAETDSCSGDSGAGVYALAPDGTPRIVAIVSRATKRENCGAGGINVFTTPPSVRTWVNTVLNSSNL